jgi:hypothetical protein
MNGFIQPTSLTFKNLVSPFALYFYEKILSFTPSENIWTARTPFLAPVGPI